MKNFLAFVFIALLPISVISQNNLSASQAGQTIDTTIYSVVEKKPEYFGGLSSLFIHIMNGLHYPEGEVESKLSGTVYLTFVVERDGSLSNIKVLRGISGSKAFEEEAIKVVQRMDKWVPAEQNGKRVRALYNLPVRFKPREELPPKDSLLADGTVLKQVYSDTNTIYTVVEEPANFPGGEEAMRRYIQNNMIYPASAKKEGRTGTCYVEFIVEKDGTLSYIHLLRSPSDDFGDEALRIVKSMPKWIPGRQNGHIIRVVFILPISFRSNVQSQAFH